MAWWSKCSHLRIENLCWDRVISKKSTWLKPQSRCGMEIKIFPHNLHCWLTLRPQTNLLLSELKGHCCLLQRLIVQALVWGEGVLQWWLEEGGESPVCPSRNYPISLSRSLDTARQYRQYMVTYKSVLNCMVISWTARKPTLYLLHGLVLSWTHCKPTIRTAPAISRAPILSLPPILQGPRNSNWSPPTISSGDSSHCHHIFTFINHWISLNFNCWCSCLSFF